MGGRIARISTKSKAFCEVQLHRLCSIGCRKSWRTGGMEGLAHKTGPNKSRTIRFATAISVLLMCKEHTPVIVHRANCRRAMRTGNTSTHANLKERTLANRQGSQSRDMKAGWRSQRLGGCLFSPVLKHLLNYPLESASQRYGEILIRPV